MASFRTFNAFRERWRTGRRSLPADNRRRECGSLFDLNKPPCSGQPAPGEQLARRQPIPPRRRRHNPRRAVALRHDPLLLRQRPAPPGTYRNNLEPRDLRNRRMVSHTPMSSPSARITQGGARRSDTDLATQGKLQSEIARTLGVSVMTLHRWRKAPPGPRPALVATHEAGQPYRMRRGGDRIAELQLENSRLRRLVTDLLLEKIKLEEAARSQSSIA